MQQTLNIVTPYLPTFATSPSKRYDLLRPHIPSHFVLLWEILQGKYDFAIEDPNRLLVLVHSVESHIHHNICTVELQDESGTTIRAWMEPKYVHEQILCQHDQEQSTIRPGVVWMLRRVGMIVVQPNNNGDEKVERMLLISGKQIEQIWTPEQAAKKKELERDSPRSQRKFLDWMEKRKAIPSMLDQDSSQEESEGIIEAEREHETDTVSYSQVAHRQGEQDKDNEGLPNTQNAVDGEDCNWVNMLLNRQQTRSQMEASQNTPNIQPSENINVGAHASSPQNKEETIHSNHESPPKHPDKKLELQMQPDDNNETASTPPDEENSKLGCSQPSQQVKNSSLGTKRHDSERDESTASNSFPTKRAKTKRAETHTSQKNERKGKDTPSLQESNVWDQIQDASMMEDMFDDDDDGDGDEDGFDGPETQEKLEPNKNVPDNDSEHLTSAPFESGYLDNSSNNQTRDNMEITQAPTPCKDGKCTAEISIFDSSNLDAVGFGDFSDDE